ncbi:hypothetical protein BT93_A1345 [Corymbia citriodora subsp. variegata]|nr:hypothetical protein BT93_A1345 [Corymbia citriodora subsp. variegata]
MAASQLGLVKFLFFLAAASIFLAQINAEKALSQLKLNSHILQDSIIKEINENPNAGWQAAMNPRFSNFTVGEFKHILGVKPMPHGELRQVPVKTHPKSLKLPEKFDARTAWSQCSTIKRILGQVIVVHAGHLVL